MRNLAVGDRYEAPIATPGIVEDAKDERCFLIETALVDMTDDNARIALARLDDALHQWREIDRDRDFIGQQIFDAFITGAFDPRFIGGTIVTHHDRGRMIKSLHQQAGLIPHANAQRREDARHRLGAKPIFGFRNQRRCGRGVLGFEQPPVARARPHPLLGRLREREMVDMGGNPPGHAAGGFSQKKLCFAMFEPRVLARRNQRVDFILQRRHPIGIIGVKPVGQIDEGLAVGLRDDGADCGQTSSVDWHGVVK